VTFFVDENIAFGIRELQEFCEDDVYRVYVVLIEDQSSLSQMITITYYGSSPFEGPE